MLWKGSVSVEVLANRPKLWENCPFPQSFHTRKLGEFSVFYAVMPETSPLANIVSEMNMVKIGTQVPHLSSLSIFLKISILDVLTGF